MRLGSRAAAAAAVALLSIFAVPVVVAPAWAADAPKRGGTLTYMIPADAPPSFDGHREKHLRDGACGRAVLQRADPGQPGEPVLDDRFRLRSVHRDAAADRWRQDLHLQDPRRGQIPRRLAADRRRCRGELAEIIFPPKGVIERPRQAISLMVDKVEAPDPTTVVFRLKFATTAFLPALADPFTFIYKKEILDKDPHWYEKNIMGSGPVQIRRLRDRPVDQGRAQPRLLPQGAALSRRLCRHLRRQAGDPGRRDPRRPRRDRVPRHAALGPRRAGQGARRQDRGAGKRLELRQPDHPEPQEKAVRRCAGAPRADPGDRPLGRRAGAVEDRHRADGRRHRLPGLAAGRDQGGTAADAPASGPTSRSRGPRRGGC